MSQLVAFDSKNLPAHIVARAAKRTNHALTSHVGNGGFPVLSIKGKVFALVKDQERKVITRELDGDLVPASALEIVILNANPNLSKVFYINGYEDGAAGKPDCFSNDGVKPDAQIEKPQCKVCATCPKNVWGSGNGGKGRACSDSRRVAIASPDQINEPMLLRVPPASLKALAEYGKKLDNRGATFDSVVTKIKFDMEEATPKLQFLPVGFLTAEQLSDVDAIANSEKVQQIIGMLAVPEEESAESADDGFGEFDKQAKVEEATVEEKPKATRTKAKSVEAAPVVEEAAPAKTEKVVVSDDLDDLDDLLAELDD